MMLVSERQGRSRNWLWHLFEPVLIALRHRDLILRLASREIESTYRGTSLGGLWAFITPILMLTVYTFVFSIIFKTRWAEGSGTSEFSVILFSGLTIFNIFAQTVNRAPGLMLENSAYIKKVVFPLEIMPWVSVVSALFTAGTNFLVMTVAYLFVFGLPPVTALLLPVVLLPLLLMCVGLGWLLSSLGVFLRDIRQVVGVITTAMLFLSPVFYPATAVPSQFTILLKLNPITFILDATKQVLFWGTLPNVFYFSAHVVLSYLLACLGLAWFNKTRKGFADVV